MEIKWRNVFIFIYLHVAAIYGFTLEKKFWSIAIGWILGLLAGMILSQYQIFINITQIYEI